ncbi:MAG: hypothetical protein RIC36_02720 [Rhodospirillales bacterium]
MSRDTLASLVDTSRPLVGREHFTASLPPGALHFAAHSHHPRPDVTRHAMLECWDDAARLQSGKWSKVFDEVLPEAQAHIAGILNLPDPERIAIAANCHEFVARLLTCFDPARPIRLLTTDSEFASFGRQMRRAVERGTVTATLVPARPFDSFAERFLSTAQAGEQDLVFFSQVHFNTGFRVTGLNDLCAGLTATGAEVVVDGYHAFMAVPEDFGAASARSFYMAGGFKYAMSGEGACFLSVPAGCDLKPENTSWFADFRNRAGVSDGDVAYGDDGSRFMGSIFDPVGLYRLNATMRLLRGLGVGVAAIHAHVHALQGLFLRAVDDMQHPVISRETLVVGGDVARGNFLAFDHAGAPALCEALVRSGVRVDARGSIIRFGFGMYHSGGDVARLIDVLHDLR